MNRLYTFFYYLVFPFFNLFMPVRTIGREHIPAGGAVICGNHAGNSDPVVAIYAFQNRNQIHFMAKDELFHVPLLGGLLRKVGMFGVKRGMSDINAVKKALKLLKGQEKVMVFPEGTRVGDGESIAAKTGAVMFALKSGAPLLPVYIQRKKRFFHPVKVIIGEPYHPVLPDGKATPKAYHAIADDLMGRVYALKESGS